MIFFKSLAKTFRTGGSLSANFRIPEGPGGGSLDPEFSETLTMDKSFDGEPFVLVLTDNQDLATMDYSFDGEPLTVLEYK